MFVHLKIIVIIDLVSLIYYPNTLVHCDSTALYAKAGII